MSEDRKYGSPVEPNRDSERFDIARSWLNKVGLKPFNKNELRAISNAYSKALKEGIANSQDSHLHLADTRLSQISPENLPVGEEACVIEIGGTNVRVAYVKVNDKHETEIDKTREMMEIKLEKDTYDSPEEFFSTVVEKLKPKLGKVPPKAIGFIWSLPGDIQQTENGVDVRSTSGDINHKFNIPDFDKKRVGEYLLNELGKVYDQDLSKTPLVVLNDTPAVLLSKASKIGGVVGTGFNLALKVLGKIFNTESGNFPDVPVHHFASLVDEESESKGKYWAEKQISGKWLGITFDKLVRELIVERLVNLPNADALTTSELGKLLKGATDRKALGPKYGYIDIISYGILEMIAGRMAHRSAQIVGTMIGTMVKTFPDEFEKKVIIPIEGSFFWGLEGYKDLVAKYAKEISGHIFEFPQIEHAGILGAGAAAIHQLQQMARNAQEAI